MTKDVREAPEEFAAEPATKVGEARTAVGKTKLKKIGNSLGVTLPKKFLDSEGYENGDEFCILKTTDGLLLTQTDPKFERKMKMVRRIMKEDAAVLRELAK